MSAQILDGKSLAGQMKEQLAAQNKALKEAKRDVPQRRRDRRAEGNRFGRFLMDHGGGNRIGWSSYRVQPHPRA